MRTLLGLALASLVFSGCETTKIVEVQVPVETPPADDPKTPEREVGTPPATSAGAPALDRAIFPELGARTFMTANEREMLSKGTHPGAGGQLAGANGRAELDDADADGAAGGAEAEAPGAAPPAQEAVPDPTREIVEADVFKLEGDLLYVLNRYRGLVIIDVSDPDNLRIRGRLPFQAIPVEMYVREGRAYVVSSDYFVYWQYDPDADPHGFHGSQVMIVDVEDPDAPAQLGSLHVDGEVTDTRMVGDVLYTVSKRRPDYWRYNTADWEDTTWVVSLNVAEPEAIEEIDRITFNGTSTLIHVAHHAIFVAAWDPNAYLTDPNFENETLVTYVDISDAEGDLETRGRVYVPGTFGDKFKMHWHDGAFRVFSHRRSGDVTLHVVKTEHPDELEIDASLDLSLLNWGSMGATRFDGERAFLTTAVWQRDAPLRELYTFDLSDHEDPQLADRLRINLDVSHLEVHDDRLLAMGRNYERNVRNQAAVAIYDVADLAAPSELSWKRLGEGYSNSAANGDYKAFKSFPELGLVLIPLSFWNDGHSFNGVQIVDWSDDQLTERGRVENPGGVRRAFPVGDRLVAVGELSVSTIDATDRDRPTVTDALHLVRVVHDIFDVQGLQVQVVSDVFTRSVRLEVREFGRDDDSPVIAKLPLPFQWAPYVLRDGDVLHMIGYEEGQQVVRNADLRDPREPALKGRLGLIDDFHRIHTPGWGFYSRYWNPHAGLPLRNQILPATFRTIVEDADGRRDFRSELRLLDLSDVDNPRVSFGRVTMDDYPFVNKVTHGEVLYSTHVEQATTELGESLLYHVRAYVDRVDVSDPDEPVVLPSLNVPGYLVDVSDDGGLLYTVDFQWDDFGRRRNSLNVLRVQGDEAVLVEVLPVSDQIHRAALRPGRISEDGRPVGFNDRTIWLAAHKYPWWGVRSDTVASRQPYTLLTRFRFEEAGTLGSEASSTLAGYHFDLLDVDGDRALLASNGPTGLLALDISNAVEPTIEHAARTIGYISRVVVAGEHIYAPMGHFGVHRYAQGGEL